jgi:hypothetical protein
VGRLDPHLPRQPIGHAAGTRSRRQSLIMSPATAITSLTCGFLSERVTGIEPALSAWESVPSGVLMCPELRSWLSASDRDMPAFTGVNGTLMARRAWTEDEAQDRPGLRAVSFARVSSRRWRGLNVVFSTFRRPEHPPGCNRRPWLAWPGCYVARMSARLGTG